jgi:hypothetical protein
MAWNILDYMSTGATQDLDLSATSGEYLLYGGVGFFGMYKILSDSYDTNGLIKDDGPQVQWAANNDDAMSQGIIQHVDSESTIVIVFYNELPENLAYNLDWIDNGTGVLDGIPVFVSVFDGTEPQLSAQSEDTPGAYISNLSYGSAEGNALKAKFGGDYSKTTEEIFMGPIEEMAKDILIEKPNAQITFKSVSYRGFKSKQLSETSKEETQETALTSGLTYTTPTTY